MSRGTLLSVLAAAALAGGCALRSPPTHEEIVAGGLPETTKIPSSWSSGGEPAPVPGAWVSSFGDPQLETIVAEAQRNNPDLKIAAARVAIAQQQVVLAGAVLRPQVSADLGAHWVADDGAGGLKDSTIGYASVAWELDVWGRLRAQQEAAALGARAAAFDEAWARESLAALTAKAWFLCIETRQLLDLGEKAVSTYEQLLDLVKVRRSAGRDSDLNVTVITAKLASAQSAVEAARGASAEASRALETLLGRYPAAELQAAPAYAPLPAPSAVGVPSELLERRADVQAAEQRVLAAFREKEAAELALLPSFGIGLAGGRVGDTALTLLGLNPWLAVASIGMSVPIYEGGALRAEVAIATAQQAAAVAAYGRVVLNALREVEDSITNERLLALQVSLDEESVRARTESVEIATTQWVAGRGDLLWVAELQTAQLDAQSNLIRLMATQRANRIRLFQALGGAWDTPAAVALTGVSCHQLARDVARDQARSNRSRFITLCQAATKSCTNRSRASSLA